MPIGADVAEVPEGPRLRAVFTAARLTGEASALLGRPAGLSGVVAPTPTEGIDVPPGCLVAVLALSGHADGDDAVVSLDAVDGHEPVDVRAPTGAVVWISGGRTGSWRPVVDGAPVLVAAYRPVEAASAAGTRRVLSRTGS